jgi:hypothetical protein
MSNLIFETLLAEAQFRLAEKTITGISLDEAIHEVTAELELDRSEVLALQERAKKLPTQKVVEDDFEAAMDGLGADDVEDSEPSSDSSTPNSIEFQGGDDIETAVGVLMYKGIPWNTRTTSRLVFQNSTDLTSAKEALDRRWDFVSADQRTVAQITFDNLEDYQKVLDFIASKKMTVVVSEGHEDLDEDLDLETAKIQEDHKKAKKDAKEMGLEMPMEPEAQMSFTALRKDRADDPRTMNPLIDPRSRNITVSKRWK